MDSETIYKWVLAKVADGKLFDKQTQQATFPYDEIASDRVLQTVLGHIFYRQFSKVVVAAYPAGPGATLQDRATSAYRNLVGENPQAGRNVLDDWDMLVDMFDRASGGIPIELLYNVDA